MDTNQPTYGFRMDDAWNDLGISGNVASWYRFSAAHDFETTHDVDDDTEIDYPPTNALYGNSLNLQDGVIMAESNMGPDYKNQKDELGLDAQFIVPLKQVSIRRVKAI